MLLLHLLLHGQSAHIDWSSFELDAAGESHIFGPTVTMHENEPPSIDNFTGFYSNSDGFYGRPGHVEYLHVRVDDESRRIEALKLVGDHNVPRGQLSFRTARGAADAPTWRMPISLHLRDDITCDECFWWSPSDAHTLELASDYRSFSLEGQSPRSAPLARFERVSEALAREKAQLMADAP